MQKKNYEGITKTKVNRKSYVKSISVVHPVFKTIYIRKQSVKFFIVFALCIKCMCILFCLVSLDSSFVWLCVAVCGCLRGCFFMVRYIFSSSSSMLSCAVLYSILLNAFQVTSNIRCLNSYMDSYPTISSSRFGCTLFLSMLVLLHIRLSANNQKERKK